MPDALNTINLRRTPQTAQADPRQVKNSAGGYTFEVNAEQRLLRFLVLGTEGGTYYTTEAKLTQENAAIVLDWARTRGVELVDILETLSLAGRAPRQNPTLFALAAAISVGDVETRLAARASFNRIVRTGTHLAVFLGYATQFRGWGPALRKAVASWYTGPDVGRVEYQMVKYRQREGWTHRDILRSAHPKTDEATRKALFDWACGRTASLEGLPLVDALERAQETTDVGTWLSIIRDTPGLSWEMLPDAALTEPWVWRALITAGMPQTALMRQLPRLTRLGVLAQMGDTTTQSVAAQLVNQDRLMKARVHPVNVLVALRTYASGRSVRGESTWSPVPRIIDALDAAFYAAYAAVEPTNKRMLLGVDVSGSMSTGISGLPISAREAACALALVTAATEPNHLICGFTGGFVPLPFSPRQRLDDVCTATSRLGFDRTDCAVPMLYAIRHNIPVDVFQIYTDSETWSGGMHPHQALREYRERTGINARLAVVGMTSTGFSVADPTDPGQMDVVGFDSNVPTLLADFARGVI